MCRLELCSLADNTLCNYGAVVSLRVFHGQAHCRSALQRNARNNDFFEVDADFCLSLAVTLPGLPDAWGYTELGCYFGYATWQDLGARCFVAFLLHDFVNILMYYPVSELPTRLMLLHHIIFAIPCLYALSGSYFRCALISNRAVALL